MAPPRKLDHQVALREFMQGVSVSEIARRHGVTYQGVLYVVDPDVRARVDLASKEWTRENMRAPCVGCGQVLVWTNKKGRTGLCLKCAAKKRSVAADVQHGTETKYGNHGCRCDLCKQASREARQRRRVDRGLVPCAHGCGTMVEWYNAKFPNKAPECRPCFFLRRAGKLPLPELVL